LSSTGGYASKNLIAYIEDDIKARYLFRLRSKFNLETDSLPTQETRDEISDHTIFLEGRKIRVIKFFLPSGTGKNPEKSSTTTTTSVRRHDSRNFLHAFDDFGRNVFGLSPKNVCPDSAQNQFLAGLFPMQFFIIKVLKEITAYKDKSLPTGTINLYTIRKRSLVASNIK